MHERLRAILAQTRNADGGWPYHAGRQSRLEPTAWAMLALKDKAAADLVCGWVARDGLLLEPSVPAINFVGNAQAALVLGAVAPDVARRVATALIDQKGDKRADHPAIVQDSSLQGWSWHEGSFSWVEPTAWCALALKKLVGTKAAAVSRITEAETLLLDRMCEGGGWNYGNKLVYGKSLPIHVPPTAAGVLAMQDRKSDAAVAGSIAVLRTQAPREGSAAALALSWIALASVRAAPAGLVEPMRQRVEPAAAVGNLSVLAMLLYVLELADRNAPPSEFVLSV